MQIFSILTLITSYFVLLAETSRPSTIPSNSRRPSQTTASPPTSASSPSFIIPSKRPTKYSEFLFYDVFTRVSSKKMSTTTTSTTKRTNTRRPTTRPTNTHKPRSKNELAEQQVSVALTLLTTIMLSFHRLELSQA